MRQLSFYIILITSAFLYGCDKEEKQKIEYPSSGFYGVNILSLQDSDTITSSTDYSFAAELGKKADLKIILTNLSGQAGVGPSSTWFYAEGNGWSVSDYSSDQQEFISNKSGSIDLDMTFEGNNGKCKIDFYENSNSITNSKVIYW
ncbi:MAG TPA: hypothetical protein PKW80_05870 [Bacteroidales bacterium]|nr:hypothetical protein [Bacteroidales bacterium]